MKITRYLLLIPALALPFIASAQGSPDPGGITELIRAIEGIVGSLIPIAIGLLFLVFIWGLVKYVLNAHDGGKKEEGRRLMVMGIIAIFVVVAIYGIIYFIANVFGVEGQLGGQLPTPEVEGLPN
jgi:hypothetical protein